MRIPLEIPPAQQSQELDGEVYVAWASYTQTPEAESHVRRMADHGIFAVVRNNVVWVRKADLKTGGLTLTPNM